MVLSTVPDVTPRTRQGILMAAYRVAHKIVPWTKSQEHCGPRSPVSHTSLEQRSLTAILKTDLIRLRTKHPNTVLGDLVKQPQMKSWEQLVICHVRVPWID